MAESPTRPILQDAADAQALLRKVSENLGREIFIFKSRAALATEDMNLSGSRGKEEEEPDDFYEFTVEDYARMMGNKKQEVFLKTKKIRDAEAAARRARITKAIVRVQFPDNYVLEAKFQPSDSISTLIDLLKKVISRTNLPFYLYTTPPKQQLKDLGTDFYTAGLTPGALVYFSYESPKGITEEELNDIMDGPYLRSDVMALRDLHLLPMPSDIGKTMESTTPSVQVSQEAAIQPAVDPRTRKTGVKPKWMKL